MLEVYYDSGCTTPSVGAPDVRYDKYLKVVPAIMKSLSISRDLVDGEQMDFSAVEDGNDCGMFLQSFNQSGMGSLSAFQQPDQSGTGRCFDISAYPSAVTCIRLWVNKT